MILRLILSWLVNTTESMKRRKSSFLGIGTSTGEKKQDKIRLKKVLKRGLERRRMTICELGIKKESRRWLMLMQPINEMH